jgi:hypothetical protein
VALQLGPFKFPWLGKDSHKNDPYWNFFINTPPADLANTVTEMIRKAPDGSVFPTKAELHTPEITSSHVKGMAEYFGAELVGIAKLDYVSPFPPGEGKGEGNRGKGEGDLNQGDGDGYPFAIICAVQADYDPRTSPGIGGQVPVQNGLFVTFVLSAWIRELGFRAKAAPDPGSDKLAAAAGLGTLNSDGRLVTPKFGTNVHIANVIRTDLPLAANG